MSSSSPAWCPRVSLTSLKSSRSRKSDGQRDRSPPALRQHLPEPVEDQGAVGEPGQRVVQCLVAQLVGALVDQEQGPGPARPEHVDQEREQQAQGDAGDQDGQSTFGSR